MKTIQLPENADELRNVLIHEYFGINWNTVWQTAKEFIPPLKKDIQKLIELSQ